MKTIYIVRHAKSSWKEINLTDQQRPLLEKGKKRTRKVIDFLHEKKIKVDCIITSPAVRAHETGSNYGEELELAIPGCLFLSDVIFEGGEYQEVYVYKTEDEDHLGQEGMHCSTSRACAFASGAVALLLSANPCLTNEEIRLILQNTAEKLSNYTFIGGHNDEVGFGRIEILEAIYECIPNSIDPITGITTIDVDQDIHNDIIVEDGGVLTIENCTISVLERVSIIVKQGGKLYINNATIQPICETQWQGIQVWGNSNAHQWPDASGYYQQGYLEISNSTIQDALIGIQLWEPKNNFATGGILKATNAIFLNNVKSIYIPSYRNYDPNNMNNELDYCAYFINCIFEIDEYYLNNHVFYKHVDLWEVKGVSFSGCDFLLDDNNDSISEWNHGIASYDAGFNVIGRCTNPQVPCQDYDFCNFSDFYSAISATSVGTKTYTFFVNRAIFDRNIYGIKVSEVNNEVIINSIFNIYHNKSSEKDFCGASAGFGIYLENSTGFAIEDNEFSKASNYPANYIGIGIKNTEDKDEVYKNIFTDLSYANYAEGKNWRDIYIAEGLEYYCNENSNNYVDFYIAPDPGTGIQESQGTDNNVAGNTFTGSEHQYHFFNGGEFTVLYYCDQNQPSQITTEVENVFVRLMENSNPCLSHYGGSEGRLVLDSADILDREMQYTEALVDYNNVKALYDNLEDGGSTENLLSEIETAQPEDMWALRSELLGDSPHLSQEVLTEVADKTEVFTEVTIFDVHAANPDELRKTDVIQYLEEKEDPLPEYMINSLREVADGTSYKTVLQQQLSYASRNKMKAASDIIRSTLNDSIFNIVQLRNWLDNLGGIAADRQIVASYLQEGNYSDGLALAALFPQLYNLQGGDTIEHNYYMQILNMLHSIDTSGRNIFQLDSIEISNLFMIADSSIGYAGTQAKNILEANNFTHYCTCISIYDTLGYKSDEALSLKRPDNNEIELSAKPIPAGNWIAIDYVIPEDDGMIIINDIIGNLVDRFPVKEYQSQIIYDTQEVESGVYFCTILTRNLSKTIRIMVVH